MNKKQRKKGKRFWSKEKKDRVQRSNEQMLAVLQTLHPKVFQRDQPIPLAVGVRFSIKETLPEASNKAINRFLSWWCNRIEYHKSVIGGMYRYDASGDPKERISDAHKENSRRRLNAATKGKRKKKGKNKKRVKKR